MTKRPAGLILAGGEARRLGGIDKPLLELGDKSLLARIIAALTGQVAPVALSANGDPARFASYGLPVLPDGAFAGQGPLAGVLAGLDWAAAQGAKALLTVPGDTPFIPADLAAALSPAPACATSAGRTHYLVALWPVAARAKLRRFLTETGSRGVRAFTAHLRMRRVAFEAGAWDPFHNVNTSDDLAAARNLAGFMLDGGQMETSRTGAPRIGASRTGASRIGAPRIDASRTGASRTAGSATGRSRTGGEQ